MPHQRSKSHNPFQDQNTSDADTKFRIGEAIKMSPLGADRCPGLAHKTGRVIGLTKYANSVVIIFNGNKTGTAIHIDYIEALNPTG